MHFSTATTRGAEGIPSEVLWSKNKLRRGTTISSKPIVLGALTGGTHQLDRCSSGRHSRSYLFTALGLSSPASPCRIALPSTRIREHAYKYATNKLAAARFASPHFQMNGSILQGLCFQDFQDRCSILRNCSGARRIGRIARIVYRCYLRAIQSSRRASS